MRRTTAAVLVKVLRYVGVRDQSRAYANANAKRHNHSRTARSGGFGRCAMVAGFGWL